MAVTAENHQLTDDPFWEAPLFDVGPWLARRRSVMETNEYRWLEVLHEFDADEAWRADGHLSGATWLIWACGMARSTAYEKLRLAHELARRAIVRDAFAAGEISYSAARAICSLDAPAPAVDEALVNLARHATVLDVEAAVRYYQCLAGQDRPPEADRRDVSSHKGHHGLGQVRANLTNDELAFIEAVIKAFMVVKAEAAGDSAPVGVSDSTPIPVPGPESAASARADGDLPTSEAGAPSGPDVEVGSTGSEEPDAGAAEESGLSARADTDPADVDWRIPYGANRADAFLEIFSVALANLGGAHVAGADRYMIHVVADAEGLRGDSGGTAELIDGSTLPEGAVARMACDASFVAHLLAGGSEPLVLGRRVRDWTPAQRRAIRVRDRARCRFPGCARGVTEIHHITPWSEGGNTDTANGFLLCTRHHTIVHQGFRAEGDANGDVVFHRPDGSVLGLSRASRRPGTLIRHGQTAA